MDPLSILSIASAAANIAKGAWNVGEGLHQFFHDVKIIDQTVGGLIVEVKALSGACTLVDERLRDIVQNFDHDITKANDSRVKLWACVEAQVEDSQRSVDQLQTAISGLVKDGTNPFAQAWRQVKLHMQTKDIGEARNRIRSHTASLQTILQTVAIEVCYLAPKRADQQLRMLLSRTEECMTQLKALRLERAETATKVTANEDAVLELSESITVDGESLYTKSQASGSLLGYDSQIASKGVNVSEWMRDIRAIDGIVSRSTSTRKADVVPPSSNPDSTLGTIQTMVPLAGDTHTVQHLHKVTEDDGSDDEMTVELALAALATGKSHFADGEYQEASSYLRETLKIVRELPAKRQKICDTWELHYMLSVCAFHTLDLAEAERDLTSVIDSSSQLVERTDDESLHLCEAGHLLSQVCVKLNKLDHARLYCENALNGRRRLLGKTNTEFYKSVALMARVYELQGSDYRAKIYLKTIPETEIESLENMFKYLVPINDTPASAGNDQYTPRSGSDREEDYFRNNSVAGDLDGGSAGAAADSVTPKERKRSMYNPARWLRQKKPETGPPLTANHPSEAQATPSIAESVDSDRHRAPSVTSDTTSLSSRLSERTTSTVQAGQEIESVSSYNDMNPRQGGYSNAVLATKHGDGQNPGLFNRIRRGDTTLYPPPPYSTAMHTKMRELTLRSRNSDSAYFSNKAKTAGYMKMKPNIIEAIREGVYERSQVDKMLAERAKAIRNSSLAAVLVADQHEAADALSKRDKSIIHLYTNYGEIHIALRSDMDGLPESDQQSILKAWTQLLQTCHSGAYNGRPFQRRHLDQWTAYGAFGVSPDTESSSPPLIISNSISNSSSSNSNSSSTSLLLEILPELGSIHFEHQHVASLVRGAAVAMAILDKRSALTTKMGDAGVVMGEVFLDRGVEEG